MTKLVICLLFLGFYAIQTVGHMNSDPAPGRSPGPPARQSQTTSNHTAPDHELKLSNYKNNRDETNNATTNNLEQTKARGIENENEREDNEEKNKPNRNGTNRDADAETKSAKSPQTTTIGQLNDRFEAVTRADAAAAHAPSINQMARADADKVTSNSAMLSALHAHNGGGNAFLAAAHDAVFTTDGKLRTTIATAAVEAKSCREGFNQEFLNDAVVIDELTAEGDPNSSDPFESHLQIELLLEHDVFDTSAKEINCGLMYKVRLLTGIPLPATPTTPQNPSQHMHYTGEFFVETVSTLNDRERGSFVSHSMGNKLPISWFNTHHGSNVEDEAANLSWLSNEDNASNEFEAKKNYFTSDTSSDEDALHAAATDSFQHQQQQQSGSPGTTKWMNQHAPWHGSSREKNAKESGDSSKTRKCPDNKWSGSTKSHQTSSITGSTPSIGTESLSLWMVNELCEQNDAVEFRVFFRATTSRGSTANASNSGSDGDGGGNDAYVEAQTVVMYKKTFKFKLRKDCQLMLREATAGILEYTALPLYSIDCTVHFPSYQHLSEPTTDTHSSGILIELQRLNVPCSSGGYVRFNEHPALCGKLEELNETDRAHHFDVRRSTSVHVYKNPMFSLSYKLVDYCYNVTTSNQTGEFYIRPTTRATLECYFRIHLPYGNRILLRLVTNNDSSILERSSGAAEGDGNTFNDEDARIIYTDLGIAVETQMINFIGSGYRSRVPTMLGKGSIGLSNSTNHTRDSGSKMVDNTLGGIGLNFFSFLANKNSHLLSGYVADATTAYCEGVIIKVYENEHSKWSHCVNNTHRMRGFILESTGNVMSVHLFRAAPSHPHFNQHAGNAAANAATGTARPAIYLSYQARPVPEIVSNCAFGWVAMQQFCVSAIELFLPWAEAEQHCADLGGHLASIRNEMHQQTVNELLLNSPGYTDQNAYWVGASDKSYEGDFRWSDGLIFQYTNWFPGWSQHGQYNKQPNDDGLSSQDCIELRRYFRTPPGIQTNRSPLTNNFMWNDRDCSAKNFLICERAQSDESLRRSWINDCNKTVSLTKEHPRAAIWSPSFPRQYPDNANCFTTITAPAGYRIVVEFEELVMENEPGCTYDYLELTEPAHFDAYKNAKSSKHKNINDILNSTSNNNNFNKTFRKRSSYENPSLSSNSNSNSNSETNSNMYNNVNTNANAKLPPNADDSYLYGNSNPNSYNNYNLAQTNYQKLLHVFSNLYKPHTNFLIQTPDYPKGNPHYHNANRHTRGDEMLPKRLCGDWSTKLKLLRHVSSGSYLGLHFVSDYSHHFGGYKAKTYMENRSPTLRAASECANERLRPYNGSCYLFVSYPEVDWWTAQQVCRGMGAKLTSVSSSDEHRFITSNIRNQIDYSPQLIYWLGAELERSGQFEWTDDTKMSFQGWLPGQGQFDVIPADAICLGLQWKMSPTPMLPSGLYWQSQKCNKVGGYVCKKPKESFGSYAFDNSTVTGTEGRLMSPAYPNTYPLNIDYWIHIKSPERTRIVVQFQKIDLEPQDECLYDYVSIQDYELVSKITLEPGTNLLPMAMLMSAEEDVESNEINPYSGSGSLRRITRDISQKRQIRVTTASQLRRRKRSNGDALFNVMTRSEIQMTYHDKAGPRTHSSTATDLSDKISGRKDVQKAFHISRGHKRHELAEHNENPKRRRRKKSTAEIENKLHRHLALNIDKNKRRLAAEMQDESQRRRRSTLMADDILSAPPSDNAQSFLPYVRWCGSHDSNMSKFDFVSTSNQVVLNFHSDYSITGLGFAAIWKSIDVSGCPLQTLTSREGTVLSPNYPHFLLNNLNCAYVIQAPVGRRVWLEFIQYDLLSDAILEVDIGNGLFRPFRVRNHLNEGIFVSLREQLRVQFKTGQHPRGKGFQAIYRTVGQLERRERVINLANNNTGYLFQLNYPHDMPENVDFTQHLVAPFGDNILLELHGVEFSDNGCPNNNMLEIYDNYADHNGTKWQLCKFLVGGFYEQKSYVVDDLASTERYLPAGAHRREQPYAAPPVYITSYLNTLHIRQRTTGTSGDNLNATVRIQWDNNYKEKLAAADKTVESCQPNPCQYNGKCVVQNGTTSCQCQGHYTGKFCGLTVCELEPCVFGKCELTATNFKCQCQPGYRGTTCEQKQRPCADNPCEGRGICFEKNGGFFCRCHAWWEGHKCERRMLHIPYKPLSERMLQEPFWLGLITVFVVLAVIGLVWCAKRHFPEKIEKLLAEEADRNRPPGTLHGHHHHTSLREQLQFTTAIPQTTVNNAPGAPRSIFNRLGIRKPSLLSLSSPNPIAGGGGAAARTFSLDDLLRPPPRRSPSPRKKRNNSTPIKKNAAEKKQILQQLVSPAAVPAKPKVSLGELITMSENRLRISAVDSESDVKETTFSENSGSQASNSVVRGIADPKLEKKVTFARLLNKVSAEMSSGSEIDIGQMGGARNSSALSLPTDIQYRASSMPPSPCTNDIRSPHSTSSNQCSDSLSSSDQALTECGLRSMHTSGSEIGSTNNNHLSGLPLGVPARCRLGSSARPKVSSADSILAMFRNFSPTATNNTAASLATNANIFFSPSNTPTVSSPQDDALGDDESSTSSMHTPVSFSSGLSDSPVFYRQTTIEVPVLDVLNAHKNSSPSSSTSSSTGNLLHPPTILLEIPNNGINKCLSPIREMPTPMPSPALTPIMPRPQRSSSPIFQEDPLSGGDYSDDDDKSDAQISERIFVDIERDVPRIIIDTDAETPFEDTADLPKLQPLSLKKLPLLRVSPAPDSPTNVLMPPPMITIDIEPPTPEEKAQRPRDLIIPTLTVEQPSPTKNRHPMIIFPGSPPPQRASIGETSFMFPNKQQQKRLLKQFEKPTSLDFPFAPPMITITSNMSELESDTDPLSPAQKSTTTGGLMPPNPVGMCYLSPFTMCGRADRTISESNLSSSGYSSMASPGPSRCGSSNPLCPNEMDEPGSGHSGAGFSLHVSLMNRRRNSALASCKENITNGKSTGAGAGASGSNTEQLPGHRPRSDSETFSDDVLIESNDEGIGTDHVDEKLEDTRLSDNRFKQLDVFMEEQVLMEVEEPAAASSSCAAGVSQMAQLQLPSIVIQYDGSDKGVSPVSSRSESPLSERAGMGRFSPHFYGRKDLLPFTDSDGLYDFPSSDGKGTSAQSYTHQRRSSSKKRDRKSSKCSTTQSPTKLQLDVLSKESPNTTSAGSSSHVCNKHCHSHNHPCPAANATPRKSPKRRLMNRLPIASSSSSSESLTSAKELAVRPLPRRLNSPNREKRPRKKESLSEDEVADALLRRISPSIVKEDALTVKPKCKINRLRAIGNQIRFLRRLEKSIKTRERLASPSDSCHEENTDDMDSPQATSPLLQPTSPNKSRVALCRQKRLPTSSYSIGAGTLGTSSWKGMDRNLIGDDLNSD